MVEETTHARRTRSMFEPPDTGRVDRRGAPETVDPAVTDEFEQRELMLQQLAEQRTHLHQDGALPLATRTIGEPVAEELARLRASHRGGRRNGPHARRTRRV